MFRKIKAVLITCTTFAAMLFAVSLHADTQVEPVKVYTSVFPPIVTNEPKRHGYAYEIVEEIFTAANIDFQIIQIPWARAQILAQNEPESVIFPLTRTKTRDPFYDWSFILFKTQTNFVTLSGDKLTPQTARNKRIGVLLKSSWDNWLNENNYQKVHHLPEEGFGFIRLMQAGRIDTWYGEQSILHDVLASSNIKDATFSDPVQQFDTYLATNKDKPFRYMDKLKAAYNDMVTSGRLQEIFDKYGLLQKPELK